MIAKIWTKPQTQEIVKVLRKAGAPIEKINGGYQLLGRDGALLFKAMIGHNGYLVRHHEKLFN